VWQDICLSIRLLQNDTSVDKPQLDTRQHQSQIKSDLQG